MGIYIWEDEYNKIQIITLNIETANDKHIKIKT